MQKLNTVLIAVLTIAVIYLFATRNPTPEDIPEEEIVMEDLDTPQMSGRIAFIDVDSLNSKYLFLDEVKKELESAQKKKQRSMENRLRKAEERFLELQEKAPYMTEKEYQDAQVELQQLDGQITSYRERMASELMDMEVELNKQFYDRLTKTLQTENAELGFDYILGYQLGGPVLLYNDSLDLTTQVVDKLNAEYEAEKAAEAQED
jgi:outer membrane protein